MKHLIRTLVVLLPCLLPSPARSWDFRVADMEGLANMTLAYGLLSRMEGRDKDIIAIANGGTLPSANADDGDLNQDPGLVSNMVKTTGEVTLRWRYFGAYVRGFAFYDFQQELHDLERTPAGRQSPGQRWEKCWSARSLPQRAVPCARRTLSYSGSGTR